MDNHSTPRPVDTRIQASRLAHDVGKYVARIARNLPDGDIPDTLVDLMTKDLFAIDGIHPASHLFEILALPLEAMLRDDRLDGCRKMLKEIDSLRPEIQRRDPTAIRRAAGLAIDIEKTLTALHHDIARDAD